MKLKKIASLALAGVMAVGMLAGCANKPGTDNGEGQGQVETTVTLADILNQAQSKVKFSNSDVMNAALQAMLAKEGLNFKGGNAAQLEAKVEKYLKDAGIEQSTVNSSSGFDFAYNGGTGVWADYTNCADLGGLYNGALAYYYNTDTQKLEGTYTTVTAKEFKGYADAEAAAKAMAAYMDDLTEKLADHSTMTTQTQAQNYNNNPGKVESGYELKYDTTGANKYYTYAYTGNAAVITLNNIDGTTSYVLVFAINQTITEATFGA